MLQKKIRNYNHTRNNVMSKVDNRTKLCQLEIRSPRLEQKNVTCIIPVAQVLHDSSIIGKPLTKKQRYKVIGKSHGEKWKILKPKLGYIDLEKIINFQVLITDGKRIVKGRIVKAKIYDKGTTTPPTGGGLPPVDE